MKLNILPRVILFILIKQLKNELADLKVKYKQILEENRVLKVEKHRLFQKNTNLMKQIKEIMK